MGKIIKPGQSAPASGQYVEVGPRGGPKGNEVTAIKNKPMPPSSKPGNGFVLVDPTNNASGKPKG